MVYAFFYSKLLFSQNPRTPHYIKRKNLATEGNVPKNYQCLDDLIQHKNRLNITDHMMAHGMKLCLDVCIITQDCEFVAFVTNTKNLKLENELRQICICEQSAKNDLDEKYI